MGKHKMKKSKKSKKLKKVKRSKQTRHNSPESDTTSESNDGEIVWTESGTAESMPVLPPVKSMLELKEPTSESSTGDDDGEKRDGNDWLSFIEQKSKGNVKLAHLKRDIRKKEQEKADNKTRYTRELNSYYRDDVNKKFIDDPDNFWKTKTKAMETDSEGDSADDGAPTNDREYDDKGQNDKPVSAAKRLTNAERNALNAKIIKAEMFGDIELANQLKTKLKEAESCSEANEEIQYYSKSKMSKTEQMAAEEKMTVKELYFQAKSITTRDEAMRFVASSSKLRTNPIYDDEYDEVKGKKKKLKVRHDGFERIRSQDEQTESCGDCLEKMGKHLVLRFSVPELKHCYVCFTPYEPFTSNYCHIRSRAHGANNSLSGDEECWTELRRVMRLLSSFFSQYYKCCVLFMETHFLQQKRSQNSSRRHFVIDCIPLKERYEADARIYFHKAIMECGEEWSTNKKMIKLDGKPVTKMIPKGMAYFWISFGANFNGFAHVIEDEDYFSKDFGKETIACLTKKHNFKRPPSQDYDSQMKRIGEAKDKWQSFIQNH